MPREFKNSGISTRSIDPSSPFGDLYRFQIPTSIRSESSLKVIVLPSLVCSYFELDIIQAKDEMRKALLIKQGTEWIEWFCWIFLIPSICSNFNRGRDKVGVYYVRGVYFGPGGKICEFNSFKSYWRSIIFWYILQQTPTNVRTRSEFIFWEGGGKLVPRDFPLEN